MSAGSSPIFPVMWGDGSPPFITTPLEEIGSKFTIAFICLIERDGGVPVSLPHSKGRLSDSPAQLSNVVASRDGLSTEISRKCIES